jgi:Uma2 family endonuclease
MRANVTRAAEGFDRRSFTVAEILRMQDAGIIAEDENFELIEGEIVPMQAKTHVHELLKSALNIAIARALPENLWMGVSSSVYLGPNTFVEPDIVVHREPEGEGWRSIVERGPDEALIIPALPGFSIRLATV